MKLLVKVTRDSAGYYRAWCPSLPGCFAYAPSQDEAIAKLNETMVSYLASLDSPVSSVEPQVLEMTA